MEIVTSSGHQSNYSDAVFVPIGPKTAKSYYSKVWSLRLVCVFIIRLICWVELHPHIKKSCGGLPAPDLENSSFEIKSISSDGHT